MSILGNEEGTKQYMINLLTGDLYIRHLKEEEKVRLLLSSDKTIEEKLEALTSWGYALEDIFDIAFEL